MDGATPPSPVSDYKSSLGFNLIRRTVQSVFGLCSTPALCIGNTDTRWYWRLSENIYRFSPVALTMQETSMFHGVDERIGVDALASLVDFYKELVLKCDD